MTAQNVPSAPEIGHAVASALDGRLSALQIQLQEIASYTNMTAQQAQVIRLEVEAIKVAQAAILAEINIMRQMAIARARTQSKLAREKMDIVAGEVDEKKFEFDLQKNAIQADYDKSQLEFIGNFAESVSADTKSIDEVKEDYHFIASVMKAASEDSIALVALTVANFKSRRDMIREKTGRIINLLNQFLETRNDTATQITRMQNTISRTIPATVYIPFWVIGLKRGKTPRFIVMPILERLTPRSQPTRAHPYQDHLRPHPELSFSKYLSIFEDNDIIELAQKNPVKSVSPQFFNTMKSYFDSSDPNGGSIFLRSMKKFLFRR